MIGPGGKYVGSTLNRYLHLGEASCADCTSFCFSSITLCTGPVGRYLADDGEKWWLHDSISDCIECPAGKFASEPGSDMCKDCPTGTYAPATGSFACSFVDPGFYADVEGTSLWPCQPGRFSVGLEVECTNCSVGWYQPSEAQTQCLSATPGSYVNKVGASTKESCPAGRYSNGASQECTPCDEGEFQPEEGQPSCIACPSPMTTQGRGRTRCDACIRTYFFNTLKWEKFLPDEELNNQCVDCCMRCEDICDVDDEDCVHCDTAGAVLETLDVKRGWWRATPTSLKVYECPYDRSCRGGNSTERRMECFPGHRGALCGACTSRYNYDIARNRCASCLGFHTMILRSGILFLFLIFILCCLIGIAAFFFRGDFHFLTTLFHFIKEAAKGDDAVGAGFDDHLDDMAADRESKISKDDSDAKDDDEPPTRNPQTSRRQRSLRRSVLTKLKIIVAAWQISASTESVVLVRFPKMFEKVTQIFGVLGFALFDVGSFKCLFGWSFFEILVVVTVAPVGFVGLGALLYWIRSRKRLRTSEGRRHVLNNNTYGILLFLFVVLPSISTYVVTYFSCARFDRGEQRDLRVMANELAIKCTSRRYQRWAVYVAIMIAVWPVGATCGLGVLLFRNRHRLNPRRPKQTAVGRPALSGVDGFEREQRRHFNAMGELAKIKIRNADKSIAGLEFLFEDYVRSIFSRSSRKTIGAAVFLIPHL